MKRIFRGKICNGKMAFDDADRFRETVLSLEGKEFEMSLGKKSIPRSTRSNAYLWGVVYAAIEDKTGYETEEIHEIMKTRFCPKKKLVVKGDETIFSKGTSQMSQEEFSVFVDKVIRFASMDLGVIIPEPSQITD